MPLAMPWRLPRHGILIDFTSGQGPGRLALTVRQRELGLPGPHFVTMSESKKPYVPPDGEDPVDGMIKRTGCEVQYRALETCIVESDRNFKACQVNLNLKLKQIVRGKS